MMIKTQTAPLLEEGLPTKLFYRINEVAQVTGLKPYGAHETAPRSSRSIASHTS